MVSLKSWLFLAGIFLSSAFGQDPNVTSVATTQQEAPTGDAKDTTKQDQTTQGNSVTTQATTQATTQWSIHDLPHATGAPDYYLFETIDGNMYPCFRASFNGSLLVEYFDTEDKLLHHMANFSMNSTVSGECGKDNTTLILSWGGAKFDAQSLKFNFVKLPPDQDDEVPLSTWVAQSITFNLDLSRPEFQNPKKAKTMTVSTPVNETHFQTPVGMTYACQSHNQIELDHFKRANETEVNKEIIKHIVLDIWNVRMHAFKLDIHGSYAEAAPCELDIQSSLVGPKHIIPIIVAAVLCGVIVIMVVTYYFMRRRNKTSYTAM